MTTKAHRRSRVRVLARAACELLESRRLLSADLDLSFGQAALTKLNFGTGAATSALAIAMQSDGKILVAGSVDDDGFVARLSSNGALDTTFGAGGFTHLDFGPGDQILDLIALPDGKILAGGAFNRGFETSGGVQSDSEQSRSILVRLRSDGQIDANSGFGGANGYILGATGEGVIGAMDIAGGNLYTTGRDRVRRHILATGAPDPTFGPRADGIVQVVADTQLARFSGLHLDVSSGRIAVLGAGAPDESALAQEEGFGGQFSPNNDCVLLLNPDGSTVNTFHNNGIRFISAALAGGITFAADGTLFAADTPTIRDTATPPYLYHVASDGSYTRQPGPLLIDWAVDLATGADGKFYVATHHATVLRFNSNGTLDGTWSHDGVAVAALQGTAASAAIDSSGRVVMAGTLRRFMNGPTTGFVVRLSANPAGGGVTAQLQPDGTLVIDGTPAGDDIRFERNDTTLTVVANHDRFPFNVSQVKRVHVRAGGGDDDCDGFGLATAQPLIPATIEGGAGDDLLSQHFAGNQTLLGGDGNDTVTGGGGGTLFSGGAGIDLIQCSGNVITLDGLSNDHVAAEPNQLFNVLADFEIVVGTAGDDSIVGSASSETVYGHVGNDTLFGGGGSDYLDGGSGDDLLDGGAGNDALHGDGIDRGVLALDGDASAGRDTLLGAGGNDRIWGYSGDDRILGGAGIDRIYGGRGNDRIYGGASADYLFGERGDDFLDGGSGNDRLHGGAGADALFGQGGDDRFFSAGDNAVDHLFGGSGDDRADADEDDLLESVVPET